MWFSRPIIEHHAAFPASQEALEDVRQFVQSVLLATPLNRKMVGGLLLAVEEAVTNTIRHGYLYGPGRIHIRMRLLKRAVTITLVDTGRPYEPDWNRPVDADTLVQAERRGGLGLMLIKKVADDLNYRRDGDQNILTLTKHFQAAPTPKSTPTLVGAVSLRQRIGWIGGTFVVAATMLGATLLQNAESSRIRTAFYDRWAEFARTAAASATQHVINERSDAEFDQLVTGLKSAYPGIAYLTIVDASGRIRADSEHPQRVHEAYTPPAAVVSGEPGPWLVQSGDWRYHHFVEAMTLDRRPVGMVVVGVPDTALAHPLMRGRMRTVLGSAVALTLGGILVGAFALGVASPLKKIGEILKRPPDQRTPLPEPTKAQPDEIAQVVQAINEVTEAVARSEREVAQRDLARRELEQAEQLQRALLPEKLPEIPGYDAHAFSRMANRVGGDYYDLFPINGDRSRWFVIVADVAGHGFPSALVMTAVRSAVRILAPKHESPADLLAELRRFMEDHHPSGPFVTAACGILDSTDHTLTLASAGHPAVLHRPSRTQNVWRIKPKGRPVGIGSGSEPTADEFTTQAVTLAPGDSILLYTDGLSESRDAIGRFYGAFGLEGAFSEFGGSSPKEAVERILSHVDDFAGQSSNEDDVTILSIRRTPA